MTEHLQLIAKQLTHLQRMRDYLAYSTERCKDIFPVKNWMTLSFEQHEKLAAFRVRFSEFQEHLGKTMKAVAIEEEVDVERFGAVLAFMEKIGILESAERWKILREIRNALSHEYEEDSERLTQILTEMFEAVPELFTIHGKLVAFCSEAYHLNTPELSNFSPLPMKSLSNDPDILQSVSRALASEANLKVALVYGSAATGKLRRDSDVDVAVLFAKPLSVDERLTLCERLTNTTHRDIDLVDLCTLGGEILHQILTKGRVLIKNDEQAYYRLLQRMVYNAEDFMPQVRQALRQRVERFAYG